MTTSVSLIASVLPVDDVAEAAAAWSFVLGIKPSFVDGERWAQFDINGHRLALAGSDRLSDRAGVMIKVVDLIVARDNAIARGWMAGDIETGPHERRCLVIGPGDWPVTFYAPCD